MNTTVKLTIVIIGLLLISWFLHRQYIKPFWFGVLDGSEQEAVVVKEEIFPVVEPSPADTERREDTPEPTRKEALTPIRTAPSIQIAPLELPAETTATSAAVLVAATSTATTSVKDPASPPLPPLDEEALLRAVVKIRCPAANNQSVYVGSGFVVSGTTVVTAAHVIMNSATTTCDVIFPSERKPIHYLRGVTEDLVEIKKRHDEKGIDVATLTLPPLDSYPEARVIFESYPFIPYPICNDPAQLDLPAKVSTQVGDALLHFGYPSNYKDQSYLSELDGEVVVFADIAGIENQSSLDQTSVYKTPIFSYTDDESRMHPYIVSRVPSFYGDSGGLAFNKTKQCILGPHRGGTIGKASGENYTIFMVLGWEKTQILLTE